MKFQDIFSTKLNFFKWQIMFYSKKCSISEHSLFFLKLEWLVPLLESSCPISNSPSVDQWARRQVLDNWPVVFGFGQVRWCMGELKCADMCNWVYPCCICLVLDMQLRICIIVQPRCRRTRETDNIQQRFHLFSLPISLFCYPVFFFFFKSPIIPIHFFFLHTCLVLTNLFLE